MMLFFGLIAAVTLVAALLSQPSHRLAVSARNEKMIMIRCRRSPSSFVLEEQACVLGE
jgi:hypothetical protein